MKTVAEMHAEWAKSVIPAAAGQVQRQEMERAFYCGFAAALRCATDAAHESGDDEELGVRLLASLKQQCMEFFMDMLAQPIKRTRVAQ